MRISSTYKILHLLYLLTNGQCTKNDIVDDFKKLGININKPSINKYIERLQKNHLAIETLKEKNENLYKFNQEVPFLAFSEKEMQVIGDIQKLLVAQKNYNNIRKTMRLFYKFAIHIKDEATRADFIDFGYYSTLNWQLIRKLEQHCKTKDVIEIDYILPQGENRYIKIHVDNLRVEDWSDRIYLYGMFENATQFSRLPVDRIFLVKQVIRENVCFDLPANILEYKISNKMYEEIDLDYKEKIISQDDKYTFIQRPIEDDFYLIQRLLYFCPDLHYVSDERIKKLLKEKLQIVKASYDN